VQNLFNVGGGSGKLAKMTHAEVEGPEDVLALCEAKGIAYLPFFPLGVLPIPGTSSPAHLEENWAARRIALSQEEVREIAAGAREAAS
jgi:aryl-alcohol dehydrogenase-like predicted oxidoreductase